MLLILNRSWNITVASPCSISVLCAAVSLHVLYVSWTGDQFKIIEVKTAFTSIFFKKQSKCRRKMRQNCFMDLLNAMQWNVRWKHYGSVYQEQLKKWLGKTHEIFEMEVWCFWRNNIRYIKIYYIFRIIFKCPWDRIGLGFFFFLLFKPV